MPRPSVMTLASPPPVGSPSQTPRERGLQMGGAMNRINQVMQAKSEEDASRLAARLQQEAASVASVFERANSDAEKTRVGNEAAALGLEYDPRMPQLLSVNPPQTIQAARPTLGFRESLMSDFAAAHLRAGAGLSKFGSAFGRAFDSGNAAMGNAIANATDAVTEVPSALGATLPGNLGEYFGRKSYKEKEFNKKHRNRRETK